MEATMPSRPPPIPPANRSPEPGARRGKIRTLSKRVRGGKNLGEQGRQANIRQNTRNQGYQQDR
jgi:hypothetical protein